MGERLAKVEIVGKCTLGRLVELVGRMALIWKSGEGSEGDGEEGLDEIDEGYEVQQKPPKG